MQRLWSTHARALAVLVLSALLIGPACSDDEANNQANNTEACDVGQRRHPVTGLCVGVGCAPDERKHPVTGQCIAIEPTDMGTTPSDMDTPPADMNMDPPDMNIDQPDLPPQVDLGMEDRCAAGVDSDQDGLDNACECSRGTDPSKPDTDGDGLHDGTEDANKNCRPDPGETDPRRKDTDADGIEDGVERMAGLDPTKSDTDGDGFLDGQEFGTCLDATKADTDGDGLPDDIEDSNLDGQIGTCPNRMYDPACAAGESDPCKADTDGDGTPDGDEVQYRQCTPADTQNLVQPQLLTNMGADYQLALQPGVATSAVSNVSDASVFEDAAHHYTGFIIRLTPPNGSTDAPVLADWVANQIAAEYPGAGRRSGGRQISTFDGFKAIVGGTLDLAAGTSPSEARDKILARLSGQAAPAHTLTGNIMGTMMDPTLARFQVVARSATEMIVVVTTTPFAYWNDRSINTGWLVDDVVGGTSVAKVGEALEADCVSYKVTARPKVDIIISQDASGSMTDNQAALVNFVDDLVALLNSANLDWRIGVTGVACAGISSDTALPSEFRMLFPAGGGFPPTGACNQPSIGLTKRNGQLYGQGFTTNVADIKNSIANVDGTASEYTMTMGVAAVARALPRADGQAMKIRNGAAVVVIGITDEADEFTKETLGGFVDDPAITPAQLTQVQMAMNPFIAYLQKPEIGATAFGLYGIPGDPCSMGMGGMGSSSADPAPDIHEIVTRTGGSGGSICQGDITGPLQTIADAVAGVSSGLRLRGAALAPSVKLKHAQAMSGMIVDMPRSRGNGFDYDPIVNRVSFYGNSTPVTNDRVVIPYLRWKNSILACTTIADCPTEQNYKCVEGVCL